MPIDREDAAHFFHATELDWRQRYGAYPVIQAWDFNLRCYVMINSDAVYRAYLSQYPQSQLAQCPN